jgi:hypothetical protein
LDLDDLDKDGTFELFPRVVIWGVCKPWADLQIKTLFQCRRPVHVGCTCNWDPPLDPHQLGQEQLHPLAQHLVMWVLKEITSTLVKTLSNPDNLLAAIPLNASFKVFYRVDT